MEDKQKEVVGVPTEETMVKTQVYDVENAPFKIVEHDGVFFITMGQAVISREQFKSAASANKYVKGKPWELIINAACYAMELNNKVNKSK